MPLEDLPLELLDAIFDYMNRRSVQACACVCSALRVPAQRRRFSALRIASSTQLAIWRKAPVLPSPRPSSCKGGILNVVRGIPEAITQQIHELGNVWYSTPIRNRLIPTYITALELENLDYDAPDLSPFTGLQNLTVRRVTSVKKRRLHCARSMFRPQLRQFTAIMCHPTFVQNLLDFAIDLSSLESLAVCQSSVVTNALLAHCSSSLVNLHIQTSGLEYEDARCISLNIPSSIEILHLEVQCGTRGGGLRQAYDIHTILKSVPLTSAVHTLTITSAMQIRFTRILQVMDSYYHQPTLFMHEQWPAIAGLLSSLNMAKSDKNGAEQPLLLCFNTTVHYYGYIPSGITDSSAVLESDIKAWAQNTLCKDVGRVKLELNATAIHDLPVSEDWW